MKKLTTLVTQPAPLLRRAHAILTVLTGVQAGRIVELEPGRVVTLGRGEGCDVRFDDASVSGRHATIVGMPIGIGGAFHLTDEGSTNGSVVNGNRAERGKPIALEDSDRIQLGSATMLRFSVVDDAERAALTRMYEAAFRDAVTRAYNRKHLDERLEAEVAFALRHKTELSVVMFDVDRFKTINDTYGHLAGDAVLRNTAQVFVSHLRAEDMVGRYGGEEFCVVARGISLRAAVVVAERLRAALAQSAVDIDGDEVRITVSAGVASLRCVTGARTRDSLIALADQRLYRAKEAGRNRVVGA
jgi:two-component system, cell cycle response regulator